MRDRFNVPHINGLTHDDVTWAMGWVLQEDRGLLLAQGRYPARLAAVDAPNIDAFGLVTGLQTFTPTRQVDRIIERNGLRALRSAGADGRGLLHDIDVFLDGVNARLRAEKSKATPFTRVDIFAVNALVGQIFGEGGGPASAWPAPTRCSTTFPSTSTSGHPLFVAGPQIGYFYPGLTLEADVHGPGFEARGAYSPANPGTILIGRGPDFAWSLTSSGSDLIDEYAEVLCGGSRTRYRYRGRCRSMGSVDAGTIKGKGRVRYRTTVHGPVTGYATAAGHPIAISRKRSSFGRDILFQLPFRDATLNRISGTRSFIRSFARSPFTFNVGYADDRDIAVFSAGRLPQRDPRVDPRLPTLGTGGFEWRGFEPAAAHPQQVNSPRGALLNWNNKPAPGFGSADSNWSYGSLHRVAMLAAGIARRGTHDLASVTGAMNAAATTDLRSTALTDPVSRLLRGGAAPSARAQRMLELLEAWRAAGSSRLDRDGDGAMDAGGAPAIMDAFYPRLLDAVLTPALGPQVAELETLEGGNNGPSSGFTGGGINYVDKDLRALLGTRFARPFSTRFCGAGDLGACRQAVWAALDAAGADLATSQGAADPNAWRSDAGTERIRFVPGLLTTTIRYTNRPSGIQQVISFGGHRRQRR